MISREKALQQGLKLNVKQTERLRCEKEEKIPGTAKPCSGSQSLTRLNSQSWSKAA